MAKPTPSDTARFLDSITKRADIQGRRKHVLLDRGDRLIDQAIKLAQDESDWNTDNPEHAPLHIEDDIARELKQARKPKANI